MAKRISYQTTFVILALSAMAFSMLQSLIVPAIPDLEKALHTSTTAADWLLTGYLLSAAICTPILGRVGDSIGKEKMLVIVLVTLSVGTLISAVATSFPLMLFGRLIQGAGGAIFPLSFGVIRDEYPREKVASGIGMLSAILGIGVGLGIVLAGPIIQHLSYHWLFWFPLFLTIPAAIMTAIFIPASDDRASGRINWLGALIMSAWLTTGLLAISYGPTWGWKSTSVLCLFAATIVLIPCWIFSEIRSKTPMVDMKMMRIPAVWTTNLTALLFGFGMYAMFIIMPQFAQTPSSTGYGFGASVTRSGLFLLPFALAMLFIAPLTGKLTLALGSKPLLIMGSVFAAVAYAFLAVAHSKPLDLYIAAGLLGIGVAFGYAAMSNLIVEAVPANQTGVATGMNTNIRNIGSALGSGIATSLIISSALIHGYPGEHGYVLAFIICSVALVIAAIIGFLIPTREGPSIVASESHPGLIGEAEVFVGSIGYVDES